MRTYCVINDLHIGTLRVAGTTDRSSRELREYAIDQLKSVLDKAGDSDLIVAGDLFDGFQVPLSDALKVFKLLKARASAKPDSRIYLIPGNHDLSTDSSKLSTFEFVAQLLSGEPNCYHLHGGGWLCEEDGVYSISHVPNQDLFDLALSRVPECEYLILHCNYDNGFTKELDHSLNLSMETAKKLPVKHIIIAHEHDAKTHLQGKVVLPGNQFPMSISDCLAKQNKRMVKFSDSGIEYVTTWDAAGYAEIDWKNLSNTDHKFVRVVGQASAEEAASAIEAVSKLRKVSEAYIIASAVKVLGEETAIDMSAALASVEDVRGFDVMAELKKILREDQIAVLESLK